MKIMLLITAGLALALLFSCVGHDVHLEAPDQLAEAIEAFVGDTPTSGLTTGDEAGKQNESIDL